QHDNAARVVACGAGRRLRPTAGAGRIRNAILELLATPCYRDRAREIGRAVQQDALNSTAVTILGDIAATHSRCRGSEGPRGGSACRTGHGSFVATSEEPLS